MSLERFPSLWAGQIHAAIRAGETSGLIREDISPLGGWLWWVNVDCGNGVVYRDAGIAYTRWGADRKRRRRLKAYSREQAEALRGG